MCSTSLIVGLMPCTRRLTLLIERGLLRTLGHGRTSENSVHAKFVNKGLEEGPGHSSPCPKEMVLASSRRLSRHSLPGHLHALLSRHGRKYLYLEHPVPVHPYLAEGVHAIRFHDGDDSWGLRLKP